MGKLVRDLIPDIIRGAGETPEIRRLAAPDYVRALHDKLLEEAAELRSAPSASQLEELADVYEVLLALAATEGYDAQDVARAAAGKRARRGGFSERLWLE